MDFSEYGHPSQGWLTSVKANPLAAHDGFTGNDASYAEDLRHIYNAARGAAGARLIAAEGFEHRVAMTALQLPSKRSHTTPLRIYKPKHSDDNHISGAVLYFHGGG